MWIDFRRDQLKDRFNRQLHQADKDLAKKVAAASNGRYTVAQVEDQMRLSDVVNMNGQVVESGKADEINAATTAITDTGAKWLPVPGTTNIVQDLPQPNSDIIALIVSVQKQATGDVPYTTRQDYSNVPVTTSVPPPMPTARCGGAQADCAAGLPAPTSDATFNARRTAVADSADWTSTQLGRASGTATAVANSPVAPPLVRAGAETTALLLQAGALGASGIEQIARPDAGKTIVDGTLAVTVDRVTGMAPVLAPVINEVGEAVKSTNAAQKLRDAINK